MTPVSFSACSSYADAAAAVQRALEPIGGPARFFKPGLRVLIKPNLLTDAVPDQAITTHPEIARAVIRLARAAGSIPCVADSSASSLNAAVVWDKTGFQALCDQEHVPLLNLEQAGSDSFECGGVRFGVAKPVLEADLVVNLPKVKTHTLTMLTAGVKNLYGTLPGFQKATLHKAFPKPDDMGRLLARLVEIVQPGLTIADGVVGMEGDGPSGGDPIKLGFVAASTDPVSLDAAICRVLGIPLAVAPWFQYLSRERFESITLVGDPPAPGSLHVRLPGTWKTRLISRPFVRLLAPLLWVRPAIDPLRCIRCGRCAAACPARALAFEKGSVPRLHGRLCFGCCCCHELCPVKAIHMTESRLMRLISRGRLTASAPPPGGAS
jgi:uncharacterized protein (DUF362 family)/Pyruvate/2-oxoacid:ferredoxin oxidoreductase delta subunit